MESHNFYSLTVLLKIALSLFLLCIREPTFYKCCLGFADLIESLSSTILKCMHCDLSMPTTIIDVKPYCIED